MPNLHNTSMDQFCRAYQNHELPADLVARENQLTTK